MAELEFLMVPEDVQPIVEHMFSLGLSFIIDNQWSSGPDIFTASSVEEVQRLVSSNSGFFLTHPSYFMCDFVVKSVYNKPTGKIIYFIIQGNGGPCIEFKSSRVLRKDCHKYITTGSIMYRRSFFNTLTNQMDLAPKSLVSMYKNITSMIKSKSTMVNSVNRKKTYWIGAKTLEELRAGSLRFTVQLRFEPTQSV